MNTENRNDDCVEHGSIDTGEMIPGLPSKQISRARLLGDLGLAGLAAVAGAVGMNRSDSSFENKLQDQLDATNEALSTALLGQEIGKSVFLQQTDAQYEQTINAYFELCNVFDPNNDKFHDFAKNIFLQQPDQIRALLPLVKSKNVTTIDRLSAFETFITFFTSIAHAIGVKDDTFGIYLLSYAFTKGLTVSFPEVFDNARFYRSIALSELDRIIFLGDVVHEAYDDLLKAAGRTALQNLVNDLSTNYNVVQASDQSILAKNLLTTLFSVAAGENTQ